MHEVATWAAAIPTLIGLGFALGLNPALYGTTADTLARNKNVWARLTWLLTGLLSGATLLVLVLHSFNPTSLMTTLRGRAEEELLNRAVDLVAGLLLLVAAAMVFLWKKRVPELPVNAKRESKTSANSISFFTIGFSSAIIGFTTLPIMYLTGRIVVSLSSNPGLWLLAYSVFMIALIAPFVTLAWLWSRFPAATERMTAAYTRALKWDYRLLAAALIALSGLVFIGLAVFLTR